MPKKKIKKEITGELQSSKSIYELAGLKTHVFLHNTKESYEEWLNTISLTDLQNHAIAVGLVPVDDRQLLKTRLVREYSKETGKNGSLLKQPNPVKDKSKENIENLLKKGR